MAAEQPETAYRPVPAELFLTETICLKDTRKVARDNTVKYQWPVLQLLPGAERPTLERGLEAVRQARLASSVPSSTKGPHFERIYVYGQEFVARKGQTGSRDGPDGAKANYRYFQTVNLLAMEWWSGDRHCGNADLGNSEGLRELECSGCRGYSIHPWVGNLIQRFEAFQGRPAVVAGIRILAQGAETAARC